MSQASFGSVAPKARRVRRGTRRTSQGNASPAQRPTLIALMGLQGLALLSVVGGMPAARAGDITATTGVQGLGTIVNGGTSCASGLCAVTGGTVAGPNLFHRFNTFDTRGGTITGVSIDNTTSGASNVFVGVLSPTFINQPVGLTTSGSLTWLSPAGISIQGSGGFTNVNNLNLSTATGARIGGGVFDAVTTTSSQLAALTGTPGQGRAGLVSDSQSLSSLAPALTTNGDLSLFGGLLTVDQSLLLDAQGGNLLLNGSQLAAGGSIDLHADRVALNQASLVSSQGPFAAGGVIKLEGRAITVAGSSLDSSGYLGGGQIFIGGGVKGSDPTILNASTISIDSASAFKADALLQGQGGGIVAYARDAATIAGQFSARGGQMGGDGGVIETSAARLDISGIGQINTTAPSGQTGTWLLDPTNFTISGNGQTGANRITVADLQNQLALNNVTIQTNNVSGNQAGDINVNASVSWNANRLTLNAFRNINVNANLTATETGSLSFQYGQGTPDGAGSTYLVASAASVSVPLDPAGFLWKKGSSGIEYPVVLDNGLLRFWVSADSNTPTSRYSFNGAGVLQQPAYLDGTGTWKKLTFSTRPLEFAIGFGGDGSSNWNTNGTILSSGSNTSTAASSFTGLGISNGRMDVSRYLEGSGTVTTRVDLSPSSSPGTALTITNQYNLAPSASSIRVDSTLTNRSSSSISNLRYWYGTGDDYVNGFDTTTKTRGNLTATGFQPISSSADPSNAIQISANGQGVIFYSPSPGTATIIYPSYGNFSNVYNQNPSTAFTSYTSDGAYGIYLRYPDLAPGASASSSYLYTTGSIAQASTASWNWASAVSLPGTVNDYNWFDSANWASGTLPSNGYSVTIGDDPAGTRRIIFDPALYNQNPNYSIRLAGITSYESLAVNSGTLGFGAQLFESSQFTSNANLSLNGGTLTVNGTLSVPNLLLNSGVLNGAGRIYVTNGFSQAQLGADVSLSNVAMGRQFDLFSIAANGSTTIRELYANGNISALVSSGDLTVEGGIASGNGTIDLQAAGSTGRLLLQPASQISAAGRQISLQSVQGLVMGTGAVIDASTTTGDGGTILIDAASVALNGLSNTPSINTSGITTGGNVSVGTRRQPTTVNLVNLYINADPPLVGGNITILGNNISASSLTLNVTGNSGGSVNIGNSSTSSINIQGANLIGGGGAGFAFSAASIFTSGLNVSGGSLTQFGLQSILADPSIPIATTYTAVSSVLTQSPLDTQQSPELTGGNIAIPLQTVFSPQFQPPLAISLQESNFLYSGSLATDPVSTSISSTSSPATTSVDSADSRRRSASLFSAVGPGTSTTPGSSTDITTSSSSPRTTPPTELNGATTTVLQNPQLQSGSAQAGRSVVDSGSISNGRVISLSSDQASSRFTQDEKRAQTETASKLGLQTPSGPPPSPAQIQGVLQRVMASFGSAGSSSSAPTSSSNR